MMAALPHKIVLIALIVWVSVVGCQGCETKPTSCESSAECAASQVCVSGQCRQVCNYNSDCDVDQRCFDGACVPDLIVHADASMPSDAILIDQGASDLLHADMTQDPDTSSANDVALTDLDLADQGIASDHESLDIGIIFDAAGADSVADAAEADHFINSPPTILPSGGDLWTYPSAATQSYPVVVVLQVADLDDDGPYFFELADDSDPGCAIEEGTLVYTAPELFFGAATCGVHATDSGAPPATGPIRDFVISVRAPETSCWTLLNNSALADRAIGSDDGLYVIDPDGLGEEEPFTAYCDMTSDGGGWTLAASHRGDAPNRCPCEAGDPAPTFVGDHYDCDQGTADTSPDSRWYVDNPLFDGFNSGSCFGSDETGWFFSDLGETTLDDIELRLMADQEPNNEEIGVTAMELYVR